MAATLEDLKAQFAAQRAQAKSMAKEAGSLGLTIAGGATGLIGAIAAPIAAQYLGDVFGLNRRSAAEEEALRRIRDVAEGGRTAAQASLEYQRGRTGRMATQAAAMGPARERAARQLVGQEQNIAAQQDITGQIAQVKMQEQARAQQALADIETRAGESERQRQRQMVAGAVTGGLGALAQSYGGYIAGQQRAKDLRAQARGAQAAMDVISEAQERRSPTALAEDVSRPIAPSGQAAAASTQPVDTAPATFTPTPQQTFERYQSLSEQPVDYTGIAMPGARLFDPKTRKPRRAGMGSR